MSLLISLGNQLCVNTNEKYPPLTFRQHLFCFLRFENNIKEMKCIIKDMIKPRHVSDFFPFFFFFLSLSLNDLNRDKKVWRHLFLVFGVMCRQFLNNNCCSALNAICKDSNFEKIIMSSYI